MRFYVILFIFIGHISVYGQQGATDVFNIARSGTVSQIDSIYKVKPAVIDSVNAMGFSPLILACYRGNTEVAGYLIGKTKAIDYCSENGTALTATVFKGDFRLTDELLVAGADPNIGDVSGVTPLMYAIQLKNKAMVELLLNHGADKTQKDKAGKSPFEYAIFSKEQEIINLLKN